VDPVPHTAGSNSPDTARAPTRLPGTNGGWVFAAGLTGLFLIVAVLGALHHEMARDELHAWLLARDSANLWNVFQVTRYEAHFVLWRVLLFGITRFTHNPVALQALNLLLATATIWVIARYSPFHKLEKCLLSFGYFFLYEFCIIAQDYTLVVLLMFCFCALYPRRRQRALSLSVILFLLANSLPYGLLIALIFLALLVFDWLCHKESSSLRTASHLRASVLIALVGLVGAVLQLFLMKASPSTAWKHSLTAIGFSDAMINIWRSYVPIPWGFPIWENWMRGSNSIDEMPVGLFIKVCLSLVLGVISAGVLLKKPPAVFLYVVGAVTLLSIQFVVNAGALRHKAFLFLLFIAALWVAGDSTGWQSSSIRMQRLGNLFGRWRNPFVLGLLVIQMVVGVYAYGADWFYPFSASQQTAQFLRESGLWKLPIVASREAPVAPLSAYLDKPIYYLQSSRFGTYTEPSRSLEDLSVPQVLKQTLALARHWQSDVVLVLVYLTPEEEAAGAALKSARINAEGMVVSSSAPRTASCGTVTIAAKFGCFVDEPYTIYLIHPD